MTTTLRNSFLISRYSLFATMKSLLLIDAHALIHRSFHALPPLTTPKGEPIGAIYGLTRALIKTMREHEPDFVAAAFDRPEPTFRKEMFEGYKAQRPKAPDELVSQLIKARELFQKLNIPCFELAGYEGDDIIGTLAEKFGKEKDLQITILTGDMDTLQLVKGKKIVVRAPKKGISETIVYDDAAVRARYELGPDQMTDYKGLVGDPSDNIPGVPGVGPKTALQALQEFGTIKNLYAKMSESHKLAKKFLPYEKDALFSKKLATIHTEVPIKVSLQDLEYKKPSEDDLREYFLSLGFESMAGEKTKNEKIERQKFEKPQTLDLPFKKDNFVVIVDAKAVDGLQSEKPKVAFDWKPFLKEFVKEGVIIRDPLFDIHIASWLLNPDEKDSSLQTLSSEIAKIDIETNPDKTGDALETLAGVFEEQIKKNKLEKVFYEIEMPLIRVLANMETRGITIDAQTLNVLGEKMQSELSALENEIYKTAGGPFNINSPQQISEVLFERLKLETQTKKKTATGQRKTGKDILNELADAHPVVPLILQYRETFKVFSGFLSPLREMSLSDGKVHTTYLQTGTGTGRLSSEKPNLQNIPHGGKWAKELRDAFLPSKGFSLVSLDYSQLELRLLAHITRDKTLVAAFIDGEDIHALTASKVFGIPLKDVDEKQRRVAKTLNFGILYGMGPRLFSKTSGSSLDEAKRFIAEYFNAFPEVRVWQESIKNEMKKNGFVENENGRRRWFPKNGAPGEFERAAINMPLQGLGADILKLAMIRSAKELSENKDMADSAFLLLSIHDELLFEIRDSAIADLAPRLKSIMEKAYNLSVPLTAEMKVGKKWGTMNKYGIR